MATDPRYRLYAMLKATPALNEFYDAKDYERLAKYTAELLESEPYSAASLVGTFEVVGAPSNDWHPAFVGDVESKSLPTFAELAVVYNFIDAGSQQKFIDVTQSVRTMHPAADIRGVGVDIGVGASDHWCPGQANVAFAHRAHARRTVNADALIAQGLYGQNVNVVIIDQGLDRSSIKPRNWGGGLNWNGSPPHTVAVGAAERTSHGMMIARSILDLAPSAVLYDVPLIPQRILVNQFFSGVSSAQAIYQTILAKIASLRTQPRWSGPWILVNAWAIFDRASESPLGNYTENKALLAGSDHPMIAQVKKAIHRDGLDVVFAAGNCGEFCPSKRCGGVDRGPGHSIWGANALPEVITTGSVLSDGMWAGYSSQGPAPDVNTLAKFKPDLCAPSDFVETNDAALRNSGTSTACGMTAGVVAALRSFPAWSQAIVAPATMHQALTKGARRVQGTAGWTNRFGNGILDVKGAIAQLP